MFRIRPHHWLWLSAICLVAGLAASWSERLPDVDEPERIANHPEFAAELVRSYDDLPNPPLRETVRPRQFEFEEVPLQAVQLPSSSELPVRVNKPIPQTAPSSIVPTGFQQTATASLPDSVWLSGCIELDESGNTLR